MERDYNLGEYLDNLIYPDGTTLLILWFWFDLMNADSFLILIHPTMIVILACNFLAKIQFDGDEKQVYLVLELSSKSYKKLQKLGHI